MYFNILTLSVIAATLQSSYAAPSPHPSSPSSVSTRCYTRMATIAGPKKLSTSWGTRFTSCTSTSTNTMTTTTTLPGSTSTVTVTTTTTSTAPTTVYTATVTSTETDTTTTTSTTTTTTTTSTSTTVNVASTIPASAGFLPIETTLPGSSYDGAGEADLVPKRSVPEPPSCHRPGLPTSPHRSLSSWQYPQAVNCYASQPLKCSTTTSKTTTTVTATSSAITATATSTITNTVVPSATTTTTVSTTTTTTSTTISTSTTTSTVTSTITSTTTTVYAACATNNLADVYLGATIISANQQTGQTGQTGQIDGVDMFSSTTAYDCCVAALTDPNGAAAVFTWSISDHTCYNFYTNECSAGQSSVVFDAVTGNVAPSYVYGNGVCGEISSV